MSQFAISPDPFVNAGDGTPRTLVGCACVSGNPKIAEMAGKIGFDTVWLEQEHGGASFADLETLCMAVEAGGGIPTIRVASSERHDILKALEVGAKIIVVPMVNTVETAEEIVRHGKFVPLGERGFNTRSRGLGYSIVPTLEAFSTANQTTHLIAQIETVEAMNNLEAILAVEGISGILIGPGDLSVSLNRPGAFADPEYIAIVVDIIARTKATGKHAGILVAPGPMLKAVREAGCDLFYCAGDINDLVRTWRELLAGL